MTYAVGDSVRYLGHLWGVQEVLEDGQLALQRTRVVGRRSFFEEVTVAPGQVELIETIGDLFDRAAGRKP